MLAACAGMAPLQAFQRFRSSPRGLTEDDAQARLARYGDNTVPLPRAPHWASRLAYALRDPFVAVLLCLDAVCAGIGNLYGVAVLSILVTVSCALRLHQERRSAAAATALRALVPTTATVVRRAVAKTVPLTREIPVDQLVAGDIVRLAPGDIVPADLRLLRSAGLTVSQAALTGESVPAAKHADAREPGGAAVADLPQICLAGTSVVSGSGTGIVVATGTATHAGARHRRLPARAQETCFDRGVKSISWLLIRLMLASVALVIGATDAAGRKSVVLFAVSVAIGLTPEMLPVVVNSALARAAHGMTRFGVIVKRLPAVHNLGAMDVLCTDKTGTLTEGHPALDLCLDPLGRPGPGVLTWAFLNSYWSVNDAGGLACDPVDEALLKRAADVGLQADEGFTGVDVIGFDPWRRRVSVVIREDGRPGTHVMITKGAPEDTLGCCSHVLTTRGVKPLGPAGRTRLNRLAAEHAAQGTRLLTVAYAERPARLGRYLAADETGLTLAGFVGFRDRPKASAAAALRALAASGIGIKVVTGDHPLLAARTCREAGIEPATPLTGEDIDHMTDAALTHAAAAAAVFARVRPEQKARVVRALRAAGHTVGYLGDGVNDTEAILAADVGICVDSAVGVARESADVILARKDLTALASAVAHGRHAFANIVKYLKVTVSSNAGNVASILAASAVLPFLPMLPLQILTQNICFDISQLAIAFDHVDAPSLRRPRTFDRRELARFVACFGVLNTLADLATFAILWRLGGAHHGQAAQAEFRAGWFTENLLTQVLTVILLRSRAGPSRRHRPAWPVLLAATATTVAALCLSLSPLAPALAMKGTPLAYLPLLAAVLGGYAAIVIAVRAAYRRHAAHWP